MSEPDRDPPYLREMFTSQSNLYAGLATVIASAVLSVPMGAAGAAIPLVLFGAGEAIAALFVPSWPGFRAKVDQKYREKRREALQQRLESELRTRVKRQERNWEVYARLQELAANIGSLPAPSGDLTISKRDIERVQDAPGEYLSLWSASLSMQDRRRALNPDDLERRIRAVEADLEAERGDLHSLKRALNELVELRDRSFRLESRVAATGAALLSLPDVVEELYLALGQGDGVAREGAHLGRTIQRLRDQEEINHAIADELSDDLPVFDKAASSRASAASRRPTTQSTRN
ncbi:MAG: hypothetical protein RLZZ618_2705 [Pseudomonadota bacterium]|jgi:hypothetical protein